MRSIPFSQKILNVLTGLTPFSSVPRERFVDFVKEDDFKAFFAKRGEVIVNQGDECKKLIALIEGRIKVENVNSNGDSLLLGYVDTPELLATYPLMNPDRSYQATFTALGDVVYVTVSREVVISIIRSFPDILFPFFELSSKCMRCKEDRLKVLSRKTIRGRLIEYLNIHEVESGKARVIHTQTQLADYVGVSRPALSTEVNKMEREGLIVRRRDGFVYFKEAIRDML